MPGITDIKVEVIEFQRCCVFDLINWCSICGYFIKYLSVILILNNFDSFPFFTTHVNVYAPGPAVDPRVFKGINLSSFGLERNFWDLSRKNDFKASLYKYQISERYSQIPPQSIYFLFQYSQKSLDIFDQHYSSCRQ